MWMCSSGLARRGWGAALPAELSATRGAVCVPIQLQFPYLLLHRLCEEQVWNTTILFRKEQNPGVSPETSIHALSVRGCCFISSSCSYPVPFTLVTLLGFAIFGLFFFKRKN